MNDIIRGPVINIIDGDTFEMKVTHVGKNNKYKYNYIERIRIAGFNAPELTTPIGKIFKEFLKNMLLGKEVRCYVQTRDVYGRIVARIEVL